MKVMRCAFLALMLGGLSLAGCKWLEEQYEKPKGGGLSNVEKVQQVTKALPYGWIVDAAIGVGFLFVGAGATHHVHKKKHKKTKEKHDAVVASLLAKTTPPAPSAPSV